mgnify:CR=1 FL=1
MILLFSIKLIPSDENLFSPLNPSTVSCLSTPHTEDQLVDITISTIVSYSNIIFEAEFFFLDLKEISELNRQLIIKKINSLYPNAILSEERPTTQKAWIKWIRSIRDKDKKTLILPVFNHDLKFINGNESFFQKQIESFIKLQADKSLFQYSHNSVSLKPVFERGTYSRKKGFIVIKSQIDFFHSTYICSIELLEEVFSRIKSSLDYLPRPDWGQSFIKKMDVDIYISPIELFYHYDGYQHVQMASLPSNITITYANIYDASDAEIYSDFKRNVFPALTARLTNSNIIFSMPIQRFRMCLFELVDIYCECIFENSPGSLDRTVINQKIVPIVSRFQADIFLNCLAEKEAYRGKFFANIRAEVYFLVRIFRCLYQRLRVLLDL